MNQEIQALEVLLAAARKRSQAKPKVVKQSMMVRCIIAVCKAILNVLEPEVVVKPKAAKPMVETVAFDEVVIDSPTESTYRDAPELKTTVWSNN